MVLRGCLMGLSVLALLLAAGGQAEAQRRGGTGIGLSLGQPTGLTFEFANAGGGFGQALELTVGVETVNDDLYAHLLWKFYLADVARGGSVTVPIYTAIGPFVADGNRAGNDLRLGARIPFGIALDFRSAPLQVFFELALQVEVIDASGIDLDGAAGFRFFF